MCRSTSLALTCSNSMSCRGHPRDGSRTEGSKANPKNISFCFCTLTTWGRGEKTSVEASTLLEALSTRCRGAFSPGARRGWRWSPFSHSRFWPPCALPQRLVRACSDPWRRRTEGRGSVPRGTAPRPSACARARSRAWPAREPSAPSLSAHEIALFGAQNARDAL